MQNVIHLRWLLGVVIHLAFLVVISLADCLMPDTSLENGKIIYEKINDFNLTFASENYVLLFRCNKGYERTGPQVVVCQNGKWTDGFPLCISLECPPPPHIENGIYDTDKGDLTALGSTVHYACNPGYEIENTTASSLTCIINNGVVSWSGELPICHEKTTCPDPGVPPDGSRRGECCYNGDTVRYSCKRGYKLIGRMQITCLHGGKWNAKRPRCRPPGGHCPNPPKIPHGTTKGYNTGDYYLPYEETEIICDPGYAFYGITEYVMCEKTLQWDVEFGECLETTCILPEIPVNGNILEAESTNRTEFPYKFELSYICNPGFRLIGDTYRTCDKGNWTGDEPYCEAIKCYNPRHPENGIRNGNDFNIGQKVIFSCFRGYSLIGSIERYCLPNGQWSGELTRCDLESNYCSDPGIPINGMKKGSNYDVGDEVTFRCYAGFSLVGSETRKCLPNHKWSGDEVKCLGAQDFDNTAEVSEILKVTINQKAEDQAVELVKHKTALESMKSYWPNGTLRAVQTKRILDLNYPGRIILYFVFDVSGSVKEKNFKISIKFAKALVQKIGISEDGARAGALTFSSKAQIEFNPVQYSTTKDVLDALDRIKFTNGGTATNSALRLVREESIPLTREWLGRKGLKSVIFILTDGKANTGGDPEEEAKKLRELNNAEIYCIGITGDIMKNTLYNIASEPTDEHVFVLNHYKTLEWLIQEITNGTIDYSRCGLGLETVGKSNQNSKVLGGKKVVEPWPWMAALYITDKGPEDAELKCGGSIIGQKWILTAAHCICEEDTANLRSIFQVITRLGLTDVKNFTHLQEFEAARFFIHEKYNPDNYDNDIGLIQLNGIIEYTAFVRPICLPPEVIRNDSPLYKTNSNAFATGWGHAEVVRKGEKVNVKALRNLKELILPLQSEHRCRQSLLGSGLEDDMFTESMLCAGTGDGSGDTCVGDSGGPLMQSQLNKDGNVFWTQIGIVSWGIGCGQTNTYGFYTDLRSELDWLQKTLKTVEE